MTHLIFFLLVPWTMEVVTTGTDLYYPVIAVNSLGNPYILVIKPRTSQVNYLFLFSKNASNWVADTFELNMSIGWRTSVDMTISQNNHVWAIYSIYNPAGLIVAHKENSTWPKDTIENSVSSWASIAIDNSGIPHITYQTEHLIYAYLNDSLWQKTVVDSNIFTESGCAIDLDLGSQPHISYFRLGSIMGDNPWYAKKIAGEWHCEEIDNPDIPNWRPTSIRINLDNQPCVVYSPSGTLIKYAYRDSIWHCEALGVGSGQIYTKKSLDIDSLNRPYILYSYGSNTLLTYKDSIGWHEEILPLTPTTTRGYGGSLRIDKDGIIHIARFATNDDYTYREIHYIYGTPVGVEEDNQTLKLESQIPVLEMYPNPSQNIFKIKFNSPDEYKVTVKIYDVAGELVEKIFDGKAKIGLNEFSVALKDLSAGIYFVKIETTGYSKTEKVILLK